MSDIVIINCVFPPEPVVSARIGSEIAETLHGKGYSVKVIAPPPTRPAGYKFLHSSEAWEYDVYRVKSFTYPQSGLVGRIRESYSFGRHAIKQLQRLKTVKAIYINSWPIFSQLLIVKYAKRKKIPVITHLQDLYPESFYQKLHKGFAFLFSPILKIDKYILNNSKHVIVISDNMKAHIIKTRKIKGDKIHVIPNWIPVGQSAKKDITERSGRYENIIAQNSLLYLGNIGPVSDLENIIPLFRSENVKYQLVIAGDGSEKENLIKLVKELGLNNVSFISVPKDDTEEVISSAAICFLPIKHGHELSSVPSKLLSYLQFKKPVLAFVSPQSVIADFVTKANCGWVIPNQTVNELGDFLAQAKPGTDLVNKGINGFDYAAEHLNGNRNLEKITKIIINA